MRETSIKSIKQSSHLTHSATIKHYIIYNTATDNVMKVGFSSSYFFFLTNVLGFFKAAKTLTNALLAMLNLTVPTFL